MGLLGMEKSSRLEAETSRMQFLTMNRLPSIWPGKTSRPEEPSLRREEEVMLYVNVGPAGRSSAAGAKIP